MVGETTLTVIGNLTADPELPLEPANAFIKVFTEAAQLNQERASEVVAAALDQFDLKTGDDQ